MEVSSVQENQSQVRPIENLEQRAIEIEEVAQHRIRESSSCFSWDCARDILYSTCTGAIAISCSILAAKSETPLIQGASGMGAIFYGSISLINLTYRVSIRMRPSFQTFWEESFLRYAIASLSPVD